MRRLRAAGLFISLWIVFMSSITLGEQQPPEILQVDATTRKCGQGEVRYIEGVPFLKLRGTSYEIGLQYGALLRAELRRSVANAEEYRRALSMSLPWYVRPFSGFVTQINLRSMAGRLPREYREELEGLAQGSGLEYDDILFYAFAPEMFTVGCSSILKNVNGRIVLGRNLDYDPPSLGKYPVVAEFKSPGKYRFTTVGFIGFLGALTGVNERGLALSVNAVIRYEANESSDLPVGYKTRRILETAATMSEVDRQMKDYTTTRGWVITVASAEENDGAMYDLTGRVIYTNRLNRAGRLYVTNAFLNEEARRRFMTSYMATHPYVQARFDMLSRQFGDGKAEGIDAVIDALASVDTYGGKQLIGGASLTVNNSNTLQTIVMDPGKGRIYLAAAPGYAAFGPFLQYDLGSWNAAPYRAEDSRFKRQITALSDWAEKAAMYFVGRNFKGLITLTDLLAGDLTVHQVTAVYQAWQVDHSVVDANDLVRAIDRMIARHGELAHLRVIKAEVLLYLKRPAEAAVVLEESLNMEVNYPSTQMLAHEFLARAYHDVKEPAKAAFHARACIEILKRYALGSGERRTVSRLGWLLPQVKKQSPPALGERRAVPISHPGGD